MSLGVRVVAHLSDIVIFDEDWRFQKQAAMTSSLRSTTVP